MSGTGSHMAMFLAEGGNSIEISIGHKVKNKYICDVFPNLKCLSTDSICSSMPCKAAANVNVIITEDKEKMEGSRRIYQASAIVQGRHFCLRNEERISLIFLVFISIIF